MSDFIESLPKPPTQQVYVMLESVPIDLPVWRKYGFKIVGLGEKGLKPLDYTNRDLDFEDIIEIHYVNQTPPSLPFVKK